jgi:hypothetical protein
MRRLHQTDYYYYRPDDVRAMLPYFFDSSTWGNIRPPEDDPIIYGAKDMDNSWSGHLPQRQGQRPCDGC